MRIRLFANVRNEPAYAGHMFAAMVRFQPLCSGDNYAQMLFCE
jgi:hypothetical protein